MQSPTPNLELNAEAIVAVLARVYALLLSLNAGVKASDEHDPLSALAQDQESKVHDAECTDVQAASVPAQTRQVAKLHEQVIVETLEESTSGDEFGDQTPPAAIAPTLEGRTLCQSTSEVQ